MAYEPKVWKCDDTITAEELNRMEEGISSAQGGGTSPFIVQMSSTQGGGGFTFTLDKTWKEIDDALNNNYVVYIHEDNTVLAGSHVYWVHSTSDDGFSVQFMPNLGMADTFVSQLNASDENAYPSITFYPPM